ncbi:MAG: hypothetical protein SV375_21590, partial [Thermodesulfobacteriota bacterium]|nr:hypothetical protein [Thermodesulfobacteriota bacterium]
IAMMIAGGAITIWDTVEGFKQAEKDTKAKLREMIRERIHQAGGNAKWLQEKGLIPSMEQLKNIGFTDEELIKWGLFKNASVCN